jgi:hypothetical protein
MAMVSVTPSGDILHDGKRFEKGKEYKVDDGLAMYFRNNGWLTDFESSAMEANVNVTLDIDNITQDTEVK